ncbi:PilZ domain-containing protein [Halochromatium glycolicum]|uniref:Pilus assembly protein PilZ n=1 Tax=Halochromatium glycolicum TaxID=85075 RepID=A0AAJ0XA24_9GAMM|nr:PilZ domain-containing protein [Halochromatium glycolicum]MBK1705366.1 pilus assembly protein PilZ [Halochromatium glycolicum]
MDQTSSQTDSSGGRRRILSLVIKDRKALHAAYMPFIKNGGLFVPTTRTYRLGDELFLLVQLLDEPERIPIAGTVVWVTPVGSEGNRAAGVGVQFNEQDKSDVRRKFEQYLPGGAEAQRPTHTM